jgi:hypothetical protein
METPLIAGFVEKQHEAKIWRGAARRLRVKQAFPTAMWQQNNPDEGISQTTYIPCYMHNLNIVYLFFLSEPIFIFNLKLTVEAYRSLCKIMRPLKLFLRRLKLTGCMLVNFIAIESVELQPLRNFGLEADSSLPQRGDLP